MTEAIGTLDIGLVDAVPMFRLGFKTAMEQRGHRVTTDYDSKKFLARVTEHAPDVAVVGAVLAHETELTHIQASIDLIRTLHESTSVRALLLAYDLTGQQIMEALAVGASGCVLKTAPVKGLLDSLGLVAQGEVALSPNLSAMLSKQIQTRHLNQNGHTLSPRELEVLRHTAEGKQHSHIAQELSIEPATVKTHLRKIYRKLEVPDRAAAVYKAMQLGYLR